MRQHLLRRVMLAGSQRVHYSLSAGAGSTASETTRLKKILEIRLTHVIEKYKNDVNSRKLSIINGAGVVHGSSRNYPKEYCFTSTEKIL